jgi:hypothetical protein
LTTCSLGANSSHFNLSQGNTEAFGYLQHNIFTFLAITAITETEKRWPHRINSGDRQQNNRSYRGSRGDVEEKRYWRTNQD